MPFVDVPADLCCPIGCDLFQDPVVTKTGDSYSRKSIERWFATCDEKKQPLTSPATNEVLTSRDLIPNRELQSRVSKFRESLLSGNALLAVIVSGDVKKLESANLLKSDLSGLFLSKSLIPATALSICIRSRQIDMARWLLPYVNIDELSGGGKSALYYACGLAPELVPILLDANPNVNLTTDRGYAPLHFAAERNPYLVPILLAKGAQVDLRSNWNETPLMLSKNIETVRILVANGADLFAVDKNGRSALFNPTGPRYFEDLLQLMAATCGSNKQKLYGAFRSADNLQTIANHIGACANPDLIRAFIPLCLQAGGLMAGGVAGWIFEAAAGSDAERRNIFGPIWHGLCNSYDLPSTDAQIKCIKVLVELGGLPFIDAFDVVGETALIKLTNRIRAAIDGQVAGPQTVIAPAIGWLIRTLMTMIQTGADPQIKDVGTGKSVVDILRESGILWKAFELCLPLFDIRTNDSDSKAGPSIQPSESIDQSKSAADDGTAKRSGDDIDSKRPVKRYRPNAVAFASSASAAASAAAVVIDD